MLIIPAIDIKNGKCVRLTQGNFKSEIIYNENPVAQALLWEKQGARMLHLVDLDGAKNGGLANFETIKTIAQRVTIPLQVGGGIRNKETVKTLIANGIARVILGTIALENEDELKNILNDFAFQVAVALDTKDGNLMKRGWLKDSNKNTFTTALKLEKLGVKRFVYTDVIKDGTLTEPNYKEIAHLTKTLSAPVIASGGITDLNSIKKLQTMGLEAVIIGKALYEGAIELKEALYAS